MYIGKEIVIRMTVNIENCKLEDIFISYISLSAPTEGVRSFYTLSKR